MVEYTCKCCDFATNLKSNYERHLRTNKHLKLSKYYPKVIQKTPESSSNIIQKEKTEMCPLFSCKYCGKEYKYRSGLSKHVRYSCDKNKDEDLKEFVKLMNEQLTQIKDELSIKNKEIEKRDKLINKLSTKLQINNNNCIINNTIQLLNYKDTDLSHLTDNDYISSIHKMNNCVKFLTEKIHYNPNKPENMNIYISNLKNDYVTVYENGQWVLKNDFQNVYEHKEIMIEEWIEKEQDNYPELRDKFNKYVNNKENDNIINNIKEDIKLMMYNNKNKVKENEKNIMIKDNTIE